jgi:hypothetical protein
MQNEERIVMNEPGLPERPQDPHEGSWVGEIRAVPVSSACRKEKLRYLGKRECQDMGSQGHGAVGVDAAVRDRRET